MNWVYMISYVLIITLVALLLFSLIKKYVITRYKVKKVYLIILMLVILIIPMLLPKFYYQNFIFQAIQMLLLSLTFLTYLEILRSDKEAKNKPVVGRPMKKPNRLKKSDDK